MMQTSSGSGDGACIKGGSGGKCRYMGGFNIVAQKLGTGDMDYAIDVSQLYMCESD